jgi:RimJ/RimL family protein N-acetyltransferase
VIETDRLRLRPLTGDDVDAWVALHADPRVNRFLGEYTPERAATRIAGIEAQWRERGHGLCAVELRATGEFIGRAGLQYWPDYDEVEAAWTLRADTWGHGYATEAAGAFVAWGWANLDVDRITAMIADENEASARVARRLGFRPGPRRDFGRPVIVWEIFRP